MKNYKNKLGRILCSILPFLILTFTSCKDETVEKEQETEKTIIEEPEVEVLPEIDSRLAYIEIPDTTLQQFLIKTNIDSDRMVNGRIYLKDVEKIDSLVIGIVQDERFQVLYYRSLEGLEQFPNLKKLTIRQVMDSVNLSQFKNLTHFTYQLDYGFSKPYHVITKGAENLKELVLGADYNPWFPGSFPINTGIGIKHLNLRENKKLEKLVLFGAYYLQEIDLSENTVLKSLSIIASPAVSMVNLNRNSQLERLVVIKNWSLENICVNKYLEISGNSSENYQLKGLNLYLDLYNPEKFSITHCQ